MMPIKILRILGRRAAHKAVAHHARPGGRLDIRFGFALMRDPRVPVLSKVMALGFGAVFTALVLVLEIPAEALLGLFLPFLGFGLDFAIDGLEGIILPFIFASLLLPTLAPKPLVAWIRTSE